MTAVALAFGTMLIVWSTGLNEGPYADMIKMATQTWGGHLQVMHPGYEESPSMFEAIESPEEVVAELEANPDVAHATARLVSAGLFSVGERTAGASLTGVMPEREPKVSTLVNTLSDGEFLPTGEIGDEDPLPIVMGDALVARLKAKLGDEVVFMGQAADGSIAAELFVLTGVLDSGVDKLDAATAIVRLQDAQELFEMKNRAHMVVGIAHDIGRVDRVAGAYGPGTDSRRLYTWQELNPTVVSSIESDREGGVVFVLVIVLMVALSAVNTTVMSVFERSKELGVMKALGTPPATLVATVVWEAFVIALIGVGAGTLLGAGINEYMAQPHVGLEMLDQPIDFAGYQLHKIYPANTLRGTVVYPALVLAGSTLGALFPALRASRLDPVEAIRGV